MAGGLKPRVVSSGLSPSPFLFGSSEELMGQGIKETP